MKTSFRFYFTNSNGGRYLQLVRFEGDRRVGSLSLGTPEGFVKTLSDDSKTKKFLEKFTKFTEE